MDTRIKEVIEKRVEKMFDPKSIEEPVELVHDSTFSPFGANTGIYTYASPGNSGPMVSDSGIRLSNSTAVIDDHPF